MSKLVILTSVLIVLVSCKKEGCTDPIANNYKSSAKKDNGSCTYVVSDIDGKTYNYSLIGNQVWTTENLETKKYRNGDQIPQVQDATQWASLTTGAWCYYDNDPTKGILYNWHAINDPRGLAPAGWHIPSDNEWTVLSDYLGGIDLAGKKMKSTTGWINNANGTNESGFSGYPNGGRWDGGSFVNYGGFGFWWSSTYSGFNCAKSRRLNYNGDNVSSGSLTTDKGLSVRCIKD